MQRSNVAEAELMSISASSQKPPALGGRPSLAEGEKGKTGRNNLFVTLAGADGFEGNAGRGKAGRRDRSEARFRNFVVRQRNMEDTR